MLAFVTTFIKEFDNGRGSAYLKFSSFERDFPDYLDLEGKYWGIIFMNLSRDAFEACHIEGGDVVDYVNDYFL